MDIHAAIDALRKDGHDVFEDAPNGLYYVNGKGLSPSIVRFVAKFPSWRPEKANASKTDRAQR